MFTLTAFSLVYSLATLSLFFCLFRVMVTSFYLPCLYSTLALHRIHRILSQGQSARGEKHSFYHENAKFRVILFILTKLHKFAKIVQTLTFSRKSPYSFFIPKIVEIIFFKFSAQFFKRVSVLHTYSIFVKTSENKYFRKHLGNKKYILENLPKSHVIKLFSQYWSLCFTSC